MLREQLSIVMDLPFHNCLKEAQNKLTNTYCVVNGKLSYFLEIDEEGIRVVVDEDVRHISADKVESIELWLPTSGIYSCTDGSILYVTKNAIRQWLKSFSYNYYTVQKLNDKNLFTANKMAFAIFSATPIPNGIWVKGNEVYYLNGLIATYVYNVAKVAEINIINPLFKQEIKEALGGVPV